MAGAILPSIREELGTSRKVCTARLPGAGTRTRTRTRTGVAVTILAENYGGRYPAGYGESANHERGRARAGVRGGILRRRRLFIHSRAEINEACALRTRLVRLNAPYAQKARAPHNHQRR